MRRYACQCTNEIDPLFATAFMESLDDAMFVRYYQFKKSIPIRITLFGKTLFSIPITKKKSVIIPKRYCFSSIDYDSKSRKRVMDFLTECINLLDEGWTNDFIIQHYETIQTNIRYLESREKKDIH
jgi:hypothetical protein